MRTPAHLDTSRRWKIQFISRTVNWNGGRNISDRERPVSLQVSLFASWTDCPRQIDVTKSIVDGSIVITGRSGFSWNYFIFVPGTAPKSRIGRIGGAVGGASRADLKVVLSSPSGQRFWTPAVRTQGVTYRPNTNRKR